ncbi:MAG: hypothetical protein ACLR6B_00590 [Blautia sp.]
MISRNDLMEAVMRKYGFKDWDSILAAIGHGGLKEGQVVISLVKATRRRRKKSSPMKTRRICRGNMPR